MEEPHKASRASFDARFTYSSQDCDRRLMVGGKSNFAWLSRNTALSQRQNTNDIQIMTVIAQYPDKEFQYVNKVPSMYNSKNAKTFPFLKTPLAPLNSYTFPFPTFRNSMQFYPLSVFFDELNLISVGLNLVHLPSLG